jgi:hypothetical protein
MPFLSPHQTGNTHTGSRVPAIGQIRNLGVHRGQYDSADISYSFQGCNAEAKEVATYIDGDLSDAVDPAAEYTSIAGLAEGDHTLALHLNYSEAVWPDRHGDPMGQRIFLKWDRSTDTTTRQYNIYTDDAAGATPATLLMSLTNTVIEQRMNVTPDTGTGDGRISSFGEYFNATGEAMNDVLTVEITGAGTYSYDIGALSGTGSFVTGESVSLPYGAVIRFHDDPEDYDASDTYTIHIGIQNRYTTAGLTPGTYRFAITAQDKVGTPEVDGNESAPITERSIRVLTIPAALTGVDLSWDVLNERLEVTWTNPGGLDSIRVYTNFLSLLNTFTDYVVEDYRYASLSAGATSWTFSTSETGTLLFYIRPVDNGIERTDAVLYSFDFPVTPTGAGIILDNPTQLEAEAAAGGKLRIQWDYLLDPDDDVDHFELFIEAALPLTYASPITVATATGVGYPTAHFNHLTASTYVGLRYIAVRAVASDDTHDGNTAYVSVTPDATAPTFTGDTFGCPQ